MPVLATRFYKEVPVGHNNTTGSWRRKTFGITAGFALVASTLAAVPATAQPNDGDTGEFTTQRIALGGDGAFPNYRIPAVIQLNNGDILLSYDGRPTGTDSPGPNSILQRRSTDGGKTWGETTVVSQGKTDAPIKGYSDPSYVYDAETNTLFNFHVYSKDTGFWNSAIGSDDEDRRVMSAWVAVSKDNGVTWEHRSVTSVAKPDNVIAAFATSGHGIQITRGEYAGRLVQQYVGRLQGGAVSAYSVYSDDHGETWQMGEPVGTLMDENKVVELSDGTLMMNSRAHNTHTARWVSYSTNGGETWSDPELDRTLVDPRNNASIIQKNPDAAEGTREAQELLFSNSAATSRSNGSIRYSCDNGETWPVVKTYAPGAHSYSDLVALDDRTYGVYYEGANSEQIYGSFDDEWLKPFCADFDGDVVEADAGDTVNFTFTLTNNDSEPLPAGTATVTMQGEWEAGTVETPALAPGESTELLIPVTVPVIAGANSTAYGDVKIEAGDYSLRGDATVRVLEGAAPTLGARITGAPADASRDVVTKPYVAGERMNYHFRVTSRSNVSQTIYPVAGDFQPFIPEAAGNCRWRNLKAGDAYNCTTPYHTVTEAEIEDGFFLPTSTWALEDVSGNNLERVLLDVVNDHVSLRERTPAIGLETTVFDIEDVDNDGYDSAGDIVTVQTTVSNTGNVRLTDIDGSVVTEELATGDSFSSRTTHVLTADDITEGALTIGDVAATARNGELTVEATAETLVVELDVDPTVTVTTEAPLQIGNTVSIPVVEGVEYVIDGAVVSGDVDITADTVVTARAIEGYVLAEDADTEWTFEYVAGPVAPLKGNVFFVANDWTSTEADVVFAFGRRGDEVFVGDWDGDGYDTLAVRRGNTFYGNNTLTGGNAAAEFKFGRVGDEVLVGDWDGDGADTFGVRRGNTFYLNNTLAGGNADVEFNYGRAGDEVLVGDWDGDDVDTLAVRRGNAFYINNTLGGGDADSVFNYGRVSDEAFAGDFDGDGVDTVSLRRGNVFHINNALAGGAADWTIGYGRASDTILIGDWDGDGVDTPTVNRIVG